MEELQQLTKLDSNTYGECCGGDLEFWVGGRGEVHMIDVVSVLTLLSEPPRARG